MSLKAKGLLSLMLSLPDDWNYSVAGLVKLSKDGKDGVMTALAELEEFGYLTRERLTNQKGQFSGIEYNIYEQPQENNPSAETPISANPILEKPISEKAPQLNTNSINHLFNKLLSVLNTKDDQLVRLYQEYIQVRDNLGSPLTEIGLEKLIDRTERLSKYNIKVQKAILEAAIINNWKNVYLPRESELEAISAEYREELKGMFGLEQALLYFVKNRELFFELRSRQDFRSKILLTYILCLTNW